MNTYVENIYINDQISWYVLRCKPNFEFIVDSQLRECRVETWLPSLRVNPVNPRSRTKKPYFPGYMFVRGRIGDLYASRVGLMRGVVGLVSFDGVPASVPDGLIEVVKRQVQHENIKYKCETDALRAGERVWIDDPAFAGIEARFERCINGEDRVIVLLTLLQGRPFRVQIGADKVRRRAD
jgi:transcriptional antiterminator RfaH